MNSSLLILTQCIFVGSKSLSCPTLCDPLDCCLPGSSVHGIFQARVLDGLPFPTPGDLPDPGIEPTSPLSPALQVGSLPSESPGKPCTLHSMAIIISGCRRYL